MNSLDIILLIIMAVSIMTSSMRGGIREIFSLFAIVAGFILATHFYIFASGNILRLTSHKEVNDIISFLAIFIFSAVLISFIGGSITEMVNKSKLKPWNKLFGTLIGAFKGIVVCALIVYILMVFLPAKSPILTRSRAFPYVSRVSDVVSPVASGFFRDEYQKKLKEFRK